MDFLKSFGNPFETRMWYFWIIVGGAFTLLATELLWLGLPVFLVVLLAAAFYNGRTNSIYRDKSYEAEAYKNQVTAYQNNLSIENLGFKIEVDGFIRDIFLNAQARFAAGEREGFVYRRNLDSVYTQLYAMLLPLPDREVYGWISYIRGEFEKWEWKAEFVGRGLQLSRIYDTALAVADLNSEGYTFDQVYETELDIPFGLLIWSGYGNNYSIDIELANTPEFQIRGEDLTLFVGDLQLTTEEGDETGVFEFAFPDDVDRFQLLELVDKKAPLRFQVKNINEAPAEAAA